MQIRIKQTFFEVLLFARFLAHNMLLSHNKFPALMDISTEEDKKHMCVCAFICVCVCLYLIITKFESEESSTRGKNMREFIWEA